MYFNFILTNVTRLLILFNRKEIIKNYVFFNQIDRVI